jgi:sterol desaturase/sphingolipid hydroxylase (fatty acid hydroxylase superfamily)
MSQEKIEFISTALALIVGIGSIILHRFILKTSFLSLKESISNIVIFLIWRFVFFSTGAAFQFAIYTFLNRYGPWDIKQSPLNLLFCLLAMDCAYYWRHRMEHYFGFLWTQHAVHHSSPEFNFTTSLRLPWVGSYINWAPFSAVALIGFDPLMMVLSYKLILAYQYLIHTELVPKLGPLEKILNTPSNHRVHHGKNPQYIDKNFGGILIIWDILFGTYEPEGEKVVYGTTIPINSSNPFVINFKPWYDYLKSLYR